MTMYYCLCQNNFNSGLSGETILDSVDIDNALPMKCVKTGALDRNDPQYGKRMDVFRCEHCGTLIAVR